MGRKCQECGTLNEISAGPCQGGCGYVFMSELVQLACKQTGRTRQIRITTQFGRRLLSMIAGDEAVYASEPQFEILKDTASGLWLLRHAAKATHPTYYDGRPVDGDLIPILTGGRISIGPDRMSLTVTLEP
jgi:hypothetical protein